MQRILCRDPKGSFLLESSMQLKKAIMSRKFEEVVYRYEREIYKHISAQDGDEEYFL